MDGSTSWGTVEGMLFALDGISIPGATDRAEITDYLQSWLDAEKLPRIILSRSRRVVWMNAAAKTALAQNADLYLRETRLVARNASRDLELDRHLNVPSGSSRVACLRKVRGDGHFLLNIFAPAGRQDIVCLTFWPSEGDGAAEWADLSAAFGLTRGESKTIQRLFDGRAAEEVAEELDVGLNTVRTYIKRSYAKLGVSGREALFKKLSPYKVYRHGVVQA